MLYLAPEAVQNHAYLNEDKTMTYADTRKLITDYLESTVGNAPMDLSVLDRRIVVLEKGAKSGKGSKLDKGCKGQGPEEG